MIRAPLAASRTALRTAALAAATLAAAALAGCASAPPPSPDLHAFAVQRNTDDAMQVAADEPELAQQADRAYARALEAHADGDAATRIEQVHLADIFWRTATARHAALLVTNERTVAEAHLREARAELGGLQAEIARLQEVERQRASRWVQRPAVSSSTGARSAQDGASSVAEAPEAIDPIDAETAADHRAALVAALSSLGEATATEQGAWVALVDAITLDADGVATLDPIFAEPLAAVAAAHPAMQLSIDAYVAPHRDPSRVLMESQAVALGVKAALVEHGVDGRRIRNLGRGAGAVDGDLPPARVEVRFGVP